MKNDILAYIYDFLSMVFEQETFEEIENIILFGSFAKDVANKDSDIDLFFNISNPDNAKNIEEKIKKALKSFEVKAEKTWRLKKVRFPISFIVGSLKQETWKNLNDEISSSGILLYGQYRGSSGGLNPNYLIYYSLNKMSSKDKMKFIRTLFGYSQKVGKKIYEQNGLLEEIKGEKLAPNVLLVPSNQIIKIKKFLHYFKVKYKIVEAWLRF